MRGTHSTARYICKLFVDDTEDNFNDASGIKFLLHFYFFNNFTDELTYRVSLCLTSLSTVLSRMKSVRCEREGDGFVMFTLTSSCVLCFCLGRRRRLWSFKFFCPGTKST